MTKYRLPLLVATVIALMVGVALVVGGGGRGDTAEGAQAQGGTDYSFGCTGLTAGLEMLGLRSHPLELTCEFEGFIQQCGTNSDTQTYCMLSEEQWVCTETSPTSTDCVLQPDLLRTATCTVSGDTVDCGGTEPQFLGCEGGDTPFPHWDCETGVGTFHCDADGNDFACELTEAPTPSPIPTDTPAPTDTAPPDTSPPSATPEPTGTATPTGTPEPTGTAIATDSGSPTPAPTGGTTLLWGDWDCSGGISARDTQALLRNVLGQTPLSQTEPCPDIGETIGIAGDGDRTWGDADCSGGITARDTQALLRHVLAQTALSQTEPCPDIGQSTPTR